MKKPLLAAAFMLVAFFNLGAQTLIPYLGANGKFGLADESGALQIPTEFDFMSAMGADALHVRTQKNGQVGLLLRNGMFLPIEKNQSQEVTRIYNFRANRTDTLGLLANLLAINESNHTTLVNLYSKATKKYLRPQKLPKWFGYFYSEYLIQTKFIFGASDVWKAQDQMNFVDENLREIFPRDFAAGVVVDENYFIVAEGPGRCAIADRSGKIRTPFHWRSIQPSNIEGVFIVNKNSDYYQPGKAGLINADGKLLVDTIYKEFKEVPGSKYIIATKGEKATYAFNLIDAQGRNALAPDARTLAPVQTSQSNWFFIQYESAEKARYNLLDESLRPLLPQNALSVQTPFFKPGGPDRYVLAQYDNQLCAYDENMKPLLCDSTAKDIVPVYGQPLRFLVVTGKETRLCDENGRTLNKSQFEKINPRFLNGKWYLTEKDSLQGVLDENAREVLPPVFKEIKTEIRNNIDTFIWTQKPRSGFWIPYNTKGKELPGLKNIYPMTSYDKPLAPYGNYRGYGPVKQVVNYYGEIFTLPDSVANISVPIHSCKTEEGGFVIYNNYQGEAWVFNHRYENPVPGGYTKARKFDRENPVERTGLLVVYAKHNFPASKVPDNEAVIEVAKPDASAAQELADQEVRIDPICGVINARGEWVLPPKKDVRYIPITHYLVAEVPFYEQFDFNRTLNYSAIIHKVNQEDKGRFTAEHINFSIMNDQRDVFLLMFGHRGGKNAGFAYYNDKGRQVSPSNIIDGPELLRSHNLVTLAPDGDIDKSYQFIMGPNGEVLKKLENNLMCYDNVNDRHSTQYRNYFIVQEKTKNISNYRNMSMEQLLEVARNTHVMEGIMDSTGRLVAPVQYEKLNILIPGRLFGAQNPEGQQVLYNWSGSIVYTIEPDKYPGWHLQTCSDGWVLVSNSNTTLVLDADNKIVREFPLKFYSNHSGLPDAYFTPEVVGPGYWVNFRNGKEFKE